MDVLSRARAFATRAYGSDGELEHPNEVAELVGSGDEELAAAAILHDLIEDTDVEIEDIEREFGPRVTGLVGAMTEDRSITEYQTRKQEGRERARDAGRDASILFVADKLSNARRMRRGQKKPEGRKLQHYGDTVETMKAAYPDLPLLPELEEELRLRAQRTQSSEQAPQPGARA